MDHEEALALLPAYLDQELGIADTLAVERHLGQCADCRELVARQRTISMQLKNARYFAAPAQLGVRIMSALPTDVPHEGRGKRHFFNWFNAGSAIVALLAIGMS